MKIIQYKDGWLRVDEDSSNIKAGDQITDGKNIYKAPDIDAFIGLFKIHAATANLGLPVKELKVEKDVTDDEINKAVDEYAFQVPYDGSNKFYDELKLKYFKDGILWMKKQQELQILTETESLIVVRG